MRIFVVTAERRNWRRKDIKVHWERRSNPLQVTRRYVLIIDDPKLRDMVKQEFSATPNAIYPHETGKDFIFYCIAGPSIRREKEFVKSLFYKLRKAGVQEEDIGKLELYTA